MAGRYRNTGAAFWSGDRETGRRVGRGEVYEPTADDLNRRAHKLRPEDGQEPTRATRRVPAPPTAPLGRYEGFSKTDFASDNAYEVARALGLSDLAFQGSKGTGTGGAWTVADVKKLVGEPDDERAGFPTTDFASEAAYEEARDAGLSDKTFKRKKGSGKDGAFTVVDVREIIAKAAPADPAEE